MWEVHVRVSKRVSGKEMEGDAKGLLQTFLFHKNNFRNCSHFIALILRRNYKKKQIVLVRNQVLTLQSCVRVLAAMNPGPV